MKNSQRGFIPLLIIIVIAAAAIGGGGYYYVSHNAPENTTSPENLQVQEQEEQNQQTPQPDTQNNEVTEQPKTEVKKETVSVTTTPAQTCLQNKYPGIEIVAKKYGAKVEAVQISDTGANVNCQVYITWANKPSDLGKCTAARSGFLKEAVSINGAINYPAFYCGDYMSGQECITKPSVWACSSAQNDASAKADTQAATQFKNIKCSVAKDDINIIHAREAFDCTGMIEYTQSLCLSDKTGKYGSYATACKALAENARYKLNDKTQAIKWYSEACKKGDTYSCEDAKY